MMVSEDERMKGGIGTGGSKEERTKKETSDEGDDRVNYLVEGKKSNRKFLDTEDHEKSTRY